MRVNLTKKEIINSVFMQIGYSKKMSESILEDMLSDIVKNLKNIKLLRYLISELFTYVLKRVVLGGTLKQKRKKLLKKEM